MLSIAASTGPAKRVLQKVGVVNNQLVLTDSQQVNNTSATLTPSAWNQVVISVKDNEPAAYVISPTPTDSSLFSDASFLSGTVLYLNSNTTLNAVHNTFVDSGPLNLPIYTLSGTKIAREVAQGSFSPYAFNNWSAYFDGVSNGLYVDTAPDQLRLGATDFTLEFWFYAYSLEAGDRLFDLRHATGVASYAPLLYVSTANRLSWHLNSQQAMTTVQNVSSNQWNHVAICRKAGVGCTMYINGLSAAYGTYDANWNYPDYRLLTIGLERYADSNFFNGHISNLRITKNVCLYNSPFTPPRQQLTMLPDISKSYSFYTHKNGTSTLAEINGSNAGGKFDLNIEDFTFEFWVYIVRSITTPEGVNATGGLKGNFYFVDARISTASQNRPLYYIDTGSSNKLGIYANNTRYTSNITLSADKWYHLAFVRKKGVGTTMYVNGLSSYFTSFDANYAYSPFDVIGLNKQNWYGNTSVNPIYFSGMRMVEGATLYEGLSFAPPSGPLSLVSSIPPSSYSYVGDGGTDAAGILATRSTPLVGTRDSTVEFWVRFNDIGTKRMLFDTRTPEDTSSKLYVYRSTGNRIVLGSTSSATLLTNAFNLSSHTWHHIAWTRSLSGERSLSTFYINGLSAGSVFDNLPYQPFDYYSIGANYLAGEVLNGYITDTRVIAGSAIYSGSTCPVPTAPLTILPTDNINSSLSADYSLYFNGNNALSSTTVSNTFPSGSNNFTIEGWVFFDKNSTNTTIVDCNSATTLKNVPYLYRNTSNNLVYNVSGDRITSSTTLLSGIWHHVALVRDNTFGSTLYINGLSSGYWNDTSFSYDSPNRVFVGCKQDGTNKLKGNLSDLRVTRGMSLYSGSSFSVPTASLAEVGNNTSWSAYFDGSSYITYSQYWPGTSDFTIEFWAYHSPGYVFWTPYISIGNNVLGQLLRINRTGDYTNRIAMVYPNSTNDGDITPISNQVAADNQWNHFVLTRIGSSMKLYYNGTVIINVTDAAFNLTNSTGLTMGYGRYTGENYTGYLSNVRVLNVGVSSVSIPSSKFLPDSNTSILTLQNSTFRDNTLLTNKYVVNSTERTATTTGTVVYSTFNPFGSALTATSLLLGNNLAGYRDNADVGTIDGSDFLHNFVPVENAIIDPKTPYKGSYTQTVRVLQTMELTADYGFNIAAPANGLTIDKKFLFSKCNPYNNPRYTSLLTANSKIIENEAEEEFEFNDIVTSRREPYTSYAETALLCFTDNRFKDYSKYNAQLMTFNPTSANPDFGGFSPYANTEAYSLSSHGGSFNFSSTGTKFIAVSSTASKPVINFEFGDFTIEFWVYVDTDSLTDMRLFDTRNTTTHNLSSLLLYLPASNKLTYYDTAARITSDITMPRFSWTHVALTRHGNRTRMFINGLQQSTIYSDNNFYPHFDGMPVIGSQANSGNLGANPLIGYIADIHVVRGTALYTDNFTPPTKPITAHANTSLLLKATMPGIIDTTGNFNLVIPGSGVKVSNEVPPGIIPNISYGSLSSGSIYFNGANNEYCYTTPGKTSLNLNNAWTIETWYENTAVTPVSAPTAAQNTVFAIKNEANQGDKIEFITSLGNTYCRKFAGTSTSVLCAVPTTLNLEKFNFINKPYTWETWVNFDDITGDQVIMDGRRAATDTIPSLYRKASDKKLYVYINGADRYSSTTTTSANIWYHVALTRDLSGVSLYVNGTKEGITYSDTNYYTTLRAFGLGSKAYATDIGLKGNLYDTRIVAGSALYTSNFTVPTEKSSIVPTVNSSWSSYHDNTTTSIITADVNWSFGSGVPFTFECWIYLNKIGETESVFDTRRVSGNDGVRFDMFKSSDNRLYVTGDSPRSNRLISTNPLSAERWHHVAFVRDSNSSRLYVNGLSAAVYTGWATTAFDPMTSLRIGGIEGPMDGFISNFRVLSGTCLYTTNFSVTSSPLSSPLTNITNTALLTLQNNTYVDNSSYAVPVRGGVNSSLDAFNPYTYVTTSLLTNRHYEIDDEADNATFVFGASVSAASPGRFGNNSTDPYFTTLRITNDTSVFNLSSLSATKDWNHVAAVRERNGNTRVFINGNQVSSATTTISSSPKVLHLGSNSNVNRFIGYIYDFKILKDIAKYNSDFTIPLRQGATYVYPPYSDDPYIDSTLFCVKSNDVDVLASEQNKIITLGKQGPALNNTVFLDGSNNNTTYNQANFPFGLFREYTIETWVYPLNENNSFTILNASDVGSFATIGSTLDGQEEFCGYFGGLKIIKDNSLRSTVLSTNAYSIYNNESTLNFAKGPFFDSTGKNQLVAVGNVIADNLNKNNGATAIRFAGGYLQLNSNLNFAVSTLPFTLEWNMYVTTSSSNYGIFTTSNPSAEETGNLYVAVKNNKLCLGTYGGSETIFTQWTPNLNTWYHLAIVRTASVSSNNACVLFVDGKQILSNNTFNTNVTASNGAYIGSTLNSAFTGYLDDIRFTKNAERYTTGVIISSTSGGLAVLNENTNRDIILPKASKSYDTFDLSAIPAYESYPKISPSTVTVEYLLVGGGGSGGGGSHGLAEGGGGGGGGGVKFGTMEFPKNTNMVCTIGAGGALVYKLNRGNNGNTTMLSTATFVLTALGGGGGGGAGYIRDNKKGRDGGCGGGSSGYHTKASIGYQGAAGATSSTSGGGGGGGALCSGFIANSDAPAGTTTESNGGGDGIIWPLFEPRHSSYYTFAGGGMGGMPTGFTGGTVDYLPDPFYTNTVYGGGRVGWEGIFGYLYPIAGTTNTGGGGPGGASFHIGSTLAGALRHAQSAAGGSGVMMFRVSNTTTVSGNATFTNTLTGDYRIIRVTSSGTIKFL